MRKAFWILGIAGLLVLNGCGGQEENVEVGPGISANKIEFVPWVLEDSGKIESFKSGLKIYTIMKGPGDLPKGGNNVRVHYHGMLPDGTIFDSSFERGKPLLFTVGSGKMIPGFSEGVQRMNFGSKAILFIPPDLGYGAAGRQPNIPANSPLIFHVELLGTF